MDELLTKQIRLEYEEKPLKVIGENTFTDDVDDDVQVLVGENEFFDSQVVHIRMLIRGNNLDVRVARFDDDRILLGISARDIQDGEIAMLAKALRFAADCVMKAAPYRGYEEPPEEPIEESANVVVFDEPDNEPPASGPPDWFELPNGNWMWKDDEHKVRCVVYKKKSWSWIVNINDIPQRLPDKQRAYHYKTAKQAKAEIEPALRMMSDGISWADATN